MRLLYTFGIALYVLLIRFLYFFNPQARRWVDGRRNQKYPSVEDTDQWIWIHAASLGEFEQGRPIIDSLKSQFPNKKILLTFFSPSGYEIRKNYPLADCVLYLPADLPWLAQDFVNHFKPELAIFIKYEYWYNYINQLVKAKIPFFYVSAIYRESQPFFKFYGKWFRNHLLKAEFIFCQDENSLDLLKTILVHKAMVSGDTRFDRVLELVNKPVSFPEVDAFVKNSRVVVLGSSWPEDEHMMANVINKLPKDYKLILAPHHVDELRINQILQRFEQLNPIRLTQFSSRNVDENSRLLVIDSIGMLGFLYKYGKMACIGGGFGAGIHNTLEAVAYGIPVVFGPNYQKFNEAKSLIELGAGYSFSTENELLEIFRIFEDQVKYNTSSEMAFRFVQSNAGATKLIMNYLELFFARNSKN